MDIQELRYFIATYQYGSYARAAAEIFLSRQALRQKLQKLEEELGGPLFVTRQKRLEPTDLGERLYREARPFVSQFDAMELNILSHSQQQKNKVSIAMGLGAATFLSLDPLLSFQKEYPQIELVLSENSDAVVVFDVLSGKADFGIVGAYDALLTELNAIRIQNTRLYVQIHRENPLSGRSQLEIADLKGQPFISFGAQNHAHRFLLQECRTQGFEPDFLFCIQDNRATQSLARKHRAITWSCPPQRLETPLRNFCILPLRCQNQSWGTYIISQPGKEHSLSVHLLIRHLCAEADDL
ncbi:MAG: LysR family transcriptional regulator [Lachnospiraceae bacterium]|nr:LysR family transcriptional regulator [Lachnospiraceae bacterium]